jgi:adenylate kinase
VNELYRRFRCTQENKKERNVVFMGVPGAGKGTHSFKMAQRFCMCHLATGDLLRREAASGSEFGARLKKVMNDGGLVSDEIMIDLIQYNLDQ